MERKQAINLLLGSVLLTGCAGGVRATNSPESPVFNPVPLTETFVPTKTPFQPEMPKALEMQLPTETSIPTPTVELRIPYSLFGIDFGDSSRQVDIQISLGNGKVFNINSTPIVCETVDTYTTVFSPGKHTSCAYQPKSNSEDVFLFGHSGWIHGVKLEVEDIRHWLEDLGGYTPNIRIPVDKIRQNMKDFVGADVEITQGDEKAGGLKVLGIVRVPPDKLGPFDPGSGLTSEEIMATLAKIDPSVAKFSADGEPQIVVIFCGWHNIEEDNVNPNPMISYYAWSRYAIILGK